MIRRFNINELECQNIIGFKDDKLKVEINMDGNVLTVGDHIEMYSEMILDKDFNPIRMDMSIPKSMKELMRNYGGQTRLRYMDKLLSKITNTKDEMHYLLVQKYGESIIYTHYTINRTELIESNDNQTLNRLVLYTNQGREYMYDKDDYTFDNIKEENESVKECYSILKYILEYKLYGSEYVLAKTISLIYEGEEDYTNQILNFKRDKEFYLKCNSQNNIPVSDTCRCIISDTLYVDGYILNMVDTLSLYVTLNYYKFNDIDMISKRYKNSDKDLAFNAKEMIEIEPNENIRKIMINLYNNMQLKK